MEKKVISYQRTNKQMYPARFIEKERISWCLICLSHSCERLCAYSCAYAYVCIVRVTTAFSAMNISYAQDKKYKESYLCENVAQN